MGFLKKIDLEKGKKLFFECKGNSFNIARDWGDEYYNCNIPKKVEKEWRKEIEAEWPKEIDELIAKIKKESVKDKLDNLFSDLTHHGGLTYESKSNHILSYLGSNANRLDTFTIIRLCEDLKLIKRYSQYEKVQNKELCSKIDETVKFYADKLLSEPITVDDSYKNSRHMQDYDFSDENIRKRIQHLLE